MKNSILGYADYEVIKKYENINDLIYIYHLDGSIYKVDISKKEEIEKLMEIQGVAYAKEYLDKNKYLTGVSLGSFGLTALFIGTLQLMENFSKDNNIVAGVLIGGCLFSIDILSWKKLLKDFADKINVIDDQAKYYYYFKNKDKISEINMNNIDNYNLKDMKRLVRKR